MIERRYSHIAAVKDADHSLAGTAMRYGSIASLPFGSESVAAGAFKLADTIVLDVNHDRTRILARNGAGMVLTDTPTALEMTATLPDTSLARDTMKLVEAGVMQGLSVEMVVRSARFVDGVRIIEKADLVGLGLVPDPAYTESEVAAMRSIFAAYRTRTKNRIRVFL